MPAAFQSTRAGDLVGRGVARFGVRPLGEIKITGSEDLARPVRCSSSPVACGVVQIERRSRTSDRGTGEVADLTYILLTVAIFVLFGLIVKAVERL